MGKKSKEKETRRLRAQVEFLKAQLKSQPKTSSWLEEESHQTKKEAQPLASQKASVIYRSDALLLRQDLRKTLLLTLLAGLFLIAAYLSQGYGTLIGQNVDKFIRR